MELKNLFKVSAVTVGLILAGCGGGDINLDASNNSQFEDNRDQSNSNNNTNTGGDDTGATNPCASYVEAGQTVQGTVEGANCRYNSRFVSSSNPILVDIVFEDLAENGAHIFEESLYIGQNYDSLAAANDAGLNRGGDGPTLFIDAGATLAFQEQKAVVVNRGSQIRAEGSLSAPITFTSESDVDGNVTPEETRAWGGMVINGFGFTNGCEYEPGWNFEPNLDNDTPLALVAGENCSLAIEGLIGNDQSNFGGEFPEDSSGVLEYVVVKHAGSALSPGNELNGIAFGAVGSGTTIANLEIYANIDDGIEFFGGGVDVDNYVAVYVQDDSIDIDDGYYGTINNALIIQGGGIDTGEGGVRTGAHCVESDGASARNENDVFGEDYLSRATINNMTCISSAKNPGTAGNGDPGAGVNFEEGHLISVNNSIVTTAYADDATTDTNYCFQAEDDLDAIQLAAGLISFSNNVFACQFIAADGDENPLSLTVDTADAQYVEALTRRADGAAGPFSGPATNFLSDTGNLLATADVRPDEGTTTNILNGVLSVPAADMLVEGAALPAGFGAPGSTFTAETLAWTFGILEGSRSQPLWFEEGQAPAARVE